MTGWEDLSIALAHALAKKTALPDKLTDQEVEEWIDTHSGLLQFPGALSADASELVREHGWRYVSDMLTA